MTEAQARSKLRKLLAITLDRGAAPGEQANATRAIGVILQEHPGLRDMITGSDHGSDPQEGVMPAGGTWVFWKGVLCGVGGVAMAIVVLVLSSLSQRRSDL